jgi:hypothetical protein
LKNALGILDRIDVAIVIFDHRCVSAIRNPLTPTLSPNGERERTEFAARSRAI